MVPRSSHHQKTAPTIILRVSVGYNDEIMPEKIGRSTLEAYLGIVIAVVAVVFPMTWWLKAALVAVIGTIATDVAVRHPKTIGKHWTKRAFFAALSLTFTAALFYWPVRKQYLEDSKQESRESDNAEKPVSSRAILQFSRIGITKGQNVLRVGQQIGFKVYFANRGPVKVVNSKAVLACAVTWDIPDRDKEHEMMNHFRGDVRIERKKDENIMGAEVNVGEEVYKDAICAHIDGLQVDGLQKGTARIYLFIWEGWTDTEGRPNQIEKCIWMKKPRTSVITSDDLKEWGLCYPDLIEPA